MNRYQDLIKENTSLLPNQLHILLVQLLKEKQKLHLVKVIQFMFHLLEFLTKMHMRRT